jgi:hypothetical protein
MNSGICALAGLLRPMAATRQFLKPIRKPRRRPTRRFSSEGETAFRFRGGECVA